MRAFRSRRMMAAASPLWLVADMDKTLIDKPPPATRVHPPFSKSPAFDPAMRWLQRGGRLCVVTTDDGFRPFQKLWNDIPADARKGRRVVLATSDGAAMFYGDDEGKLVEDTAYASRAALTLAGGSSKSLRLPSQPHEMEELLNACRRVYIQVVEDLASDTQLLNQLGDRPREGYQTILTALDKVGPVGDPDVAGKRRAQLEEILSLDALVRPGAVLPMSTMLWRNQAGPVDAWVRDGTKADPFFGFYAKEGDQPGFTNLFMMALPQSMSASYIEQGPFAQTLEGLGLTASAAPNSVCVKSSALGKDLPVKYLSEHPEFQLDLDHIVAFGDNPLGNDRPLAALAAPFVSVAPAWQGPVPPDFENGGFYHVGGCEAGTAAVLELMLAALENGGLGELEVLRHLPDICAQAAGSLLQPGSGAVGQASRL